MTPSLDRSVALTRGSTVGLYGIRRNKNISCSSAQAGTKLFWTGLVGVTSIALGPRVLKKGHSVSGSITMTLKSFGTCTVHEHVFLVWTKWHNHVHAWKTSSSKGSLFIDQSVMVDYDQKEYSKSISVHAEQVGPALALPLNAILQPPTATVHTDATSSSPQEGEEEKVGTRGGREDRKEGWNWPLPFGEGVCVEAQGEELGQRGRLRKDGWVGRGPCAIRSCLTVCKSVLTQSKSICHQDCHCGTKREGSLPGRTHSERNEGRQDRHREAEGSLGELQAGSGNLLCPAYRLQTHPPKIRKVGFYFSFINTSI